MLCYFRFFFRKKKEFNVYIYFFITIFFLSFYLIYKFIFPVFLYIYYSSIKVISSKLVPISFEPHFGSYILNIIGVTFITQLFIFYAYFICILIYYKLLDIFEISKSRYIYYTSCILIIAFFSPTELLSQFILTLIFISNVEIWLYICFLALSYQTKIIFIGKRAQNT